MNEFLNIINSPLCKTKAITRYSGTRQNQIETLSDHVLDVAMMSYHIARNLIVRGVSVDIGLLLQKCIIHDVDEVLIGDIPRMTKYSSEECHRALNNLANDTAKELSFDIDGTDYTYTIWKDDKDATLEGTILRVTDMLSVANKVILEIEFHHNIGFFKVATEISHYLADVSDKVRNNLNDPIAIDYLIKIIDDTYEVMKSLIEEYRPKIDQYNIYDEFSAKIINRRDKE